jgi:hypothetical protein
MVADFRTVAPIGDGPPHAGRRSQQPPIPAQAFSASCHFLAISPFSRQYPAMNRPVKMEWLEPFRQQPEMEASDYEAFSEPR